MLAVSDDLPRKAPVDPRWSWDVMDLVVPDDLEPVECG
jgi:hypothetical protein